MSKPTRRGEDIHSPRVGARTEPASLCSLAVAAVIAWESGDRAELDAALDSLARHIGAATLDAARRRVAA